MEKIQRVQCGNGNCYIVSNGNNSILIDTCRSKYRDIILNACKPYKIGLILLTHGHIDHIQNAAYLSDKLGAPIAMHKADLELIKNNWAQPLEAKNVFGKLVLAMSLKSFKEENFQTFTPMVLLNEGDTLDNYGIAGRILSVPGHTKGSIAVDIAQKHIFVGDALMNMFYPTVSMLYNDRKEMLKSAKKIGDLGKRTIYFGHGKPVENRNWVKTQID